MKKTLIAAVVIVVSGVAWAHWYFGDRGRFTTEAEYTGLRRTVTAQDLTSPVDPAATLSFDDAFRHIGGQKFILYGVADTEQHFFVETTDDDRLKSVYWVQYESYLPGKPYTYDYTDSPLRVTLNGYTFYTDTDVVATDPNRKRARGTDGAMARALLARAGYTLPDEFVYARLVYLTDDSHKKELMIIFIDDLAPTGFTAAGLQDGGPDAAHRPDVEQAHLNRIRQTLSMRPLDSPD
ncbi:MAG: hypothetical protein R3282_01945 [Rhodothermales bacterium]|nr:hypothetical protein [Rhodothermales bacterium]